MKATAQSAEREKGASSKPALDREGWKVLKANQSATIILLRNPMHREWPSDYWFICQASIRYARVAHQVWGLGCGSDLAS